MEIDNLLFDVLAIFVKIKHAIDSEKSYLDWEVILVCFWYDKFAHKLDVIFIIFTSITSLSLNSFSEAIL